MFTPINIAAKGSRPKKGATRRTPPPPKRKTPWWLWIIVPVILIAFIYGLTRLSHVKQKPVTQPIPAAKPKVESKAAPKAEAKKAEPKKAEAKPADKKKESFDFYSILQDSEVKTEHVKAYQYEPRGEQDFLYMLQAASFRNPKDADRLRAKLILSGIVDTSVRKTLSTKDGKPWYRVVIGPFNDRSVMNHIEDKLVDMRIESYPYKIKKENQ
ncbi:SPOR domain-containing protein [Marinomonas spartinae]|uniref:SPOR domain-containing protein n=1 Tax=Marinomonas spartinae TaxID=1792290 RepID=UPI0018F1D2CD|nr:SPOR domain-containing protein [Marinomonas spartinae]MBJ7554527.1 SPOR domain-containing protein [Marinomonas spartinae]